jgi:hypothetical protein
MSLIDRAYTWLDAVIAQRTGTDLRLLYGFGVPVVVTALLVSLGIAFAASSITVAALMLVEAIMLTAVAIGFTRMLSEPGDATDRD